MPFSFTTLLQSALAQGSRSTVLRPLGWLLAICASSAIASMEVRAPQWVVSVFMIMCIATVALYLIAYIFCLFADRDALRSETFSIQKLAIEKGYIGDSSTGILEGVNLERALDQAAGGEKKE